MRRKRPHTAITGCLHGTQMRVLAAVVEHHDRTGYGPSVRDVARAAGVAFSVAHSHLRALRRQGLVDWEAGQARTLRPTLSIVAVAR